MGFNVTTVGNKATMRTRIVAKHNLFKRFKKRFVNTVNPTEKRFCKTEATRVVKELKAFAKQWKKFGFGKTGWITKGYIVSVFGTVGVARKNNRKNTVRKNSRTGRKTYARKSWSKTTARKTRRSNAKRTTNRTWSTRKTPATKARRAYSWR
jgi:hypothetical protein